MVLPAFSIMVLVVVFPIVNTVARSFRTTDGRFTLDNYVYFFTSAEALQSLLFTLAEALTVMALSVVLSFLLALYLRFSKSPVSRALGKLYPVSYTHLGRASFPIKNCSVPIPASCKARSTSHNAALEMCIRDRASVLYAVQLYADFAGYSHIAIGCMQLLGFDVPENFRAPYFSTSVKDPCPRNLRNLDQLKCRHLITIIQ